MNTITKYIKQSGWILLLMLFVVSCEEEESGFGPKTLDPTIGETAAVTEELNTLIAALAQADGESDAGLGAALTNGRGPFTVFAPTNQAFEEFLATFNNYDVLGDFNSAEKRNVLKAILEYHIINNQALPSTELNGDIETRMGETLTFNAGTDLTIIDKTGTATNVVSADIETQNGIVHIVDKVLLPDAVIEGIIEDLVDLVVNTEALSTLEEAVIKTGLDPVLRQTGPFTVFAPTDDAFVALFNLLGDDYNSIDDFDTEEEIALLTDILLYHVLPVEVLSASLAEGTVATALEGNELSVIPQGDTFVIGDATQAIANITGPDILALNGVAHTVNKVLLPQSAVDFVTSINIKSVYETLASQNQYALLSASLAHVEDGLVELLSGEGSFTIFAPTNEAIRDFFGSIPDCGSLDDFDTPEEKAFLATVLKYHIFTPETFAADFVSGAPITTAQGETLIVNVGEDVTIDDATPVDANVTQADVDATNGVIHRIDKVLQPQETVTALGN